MRKLVTQEMKEEIKRRYLNGETARNIALSYPDFSESTISRHIRQMGISRGKGKKPEYAEIEEKIVKEYVNDKMATCASLARKYGLYDRTVAKWIGDHGIKIKGIGVPSKCNEDYFVNIDTPNKAYILGFLTADGAVVGNGSSKSCSIEIKKDDIDLLYFVRNEINPEATITSCHYGKKNNVRVGFNSTKLCDSLAKYGIIQNKSKTITKVPTEYIPKQLLCFYFRGLIDGDGCIHKDGKISIYSGSYLFINDVRRILVEETGVAELGIYQGTSYFVSWGSRRDKRLLYHYLYDDLNATFYYERKYRRLYDFIEHDNTEVSD